MRDLFRRLAATPADELEALMLAGRRPEAEDLIDREFRGLNLLPGARTLGIRKFIKGFFRPPGSERVEGYNVRVAQNGDTEEWTPEPGRERFGFYVVRSGANGPSLRYPQSLLLDYGASARNPRLRLERLLRDYLVVPDPGRPDVLLGKAFLAVGGSGVKAGYFVLERVDGEPTLDPTRLPGRPDRPAG
jgi:hypothetical protein